MADFSTAPAAPLEMTRIEIAALALGLLAMTRLRRSYAVAGGAGMTKREGEREKGKVRRD